MIKHDLHNKILITINKDDGDELLITIHLERDGKMRYNQIAELMAKLNNFIENPI